MNAQAKPRRAASAVVFAYHQVGVRCLKVLLAHGVDVCLVVTHCDSPGETLWFESVADTACEHGIETVLPENANDPEVLARVAACQPDFLFSFYFRQMLAPAMLATAPRGAFNMHGSLLPRYRGRVPVNWAVLHGERETGATLHAMSPKPDDGPIVDQQAVPILPDDTAAEVFAKVVVAAEMVLHRCLPALIAGTAAMHPQDSLRSTYFGGRRPEDGRIDWRASAAQIHNLVRAVAPPYPGAFTTVRGQTLRILRTLPLLTTSENSVASTRTSVEDSTTPPDFSTTPGPALLAHEGRLYARCGDGRLLRVLAAELDGVALDAARFQQRFGPQLALVS